MQKTNLDLTKNGKFKMRGQNTVEKWGLFEWNLNIWKFI